MATILEDLKKIPSIVWNGIVFVAVFSLMFACNPEITPPGEEVPAPPGVSFAIVAQTDTILTVQVRWSKVEDGYGAADYYVHTMTAGKVVTDSTTGPLPNAKQVNGLADTIKIRVQLVNDTVTLESKVWSVRRGLQSLTPAIGRLVVRRGDVPPPPPDSISVDTIVVAMIFGGGSSSASYGICCGQNPPGPWLDTIRFNRIYNGNPGAPYVGASDLINTYQGQTIVSSYHHPLIKFRFNPSGYVTHAVDSNTAIFKVLPFSTSRYIWIVAEYSGKKDSLRTWVSGLDVSVGYCGPWPDCYYNPIPIQYPELPREYVDVPPYVENTNPAMILCYGPMDAQGKFKVDTLYPPSTVADCPS